MLLLLLWILHLVATLCWYHCGRMGISGLVAGRIVCNESNRNVGVIGGVKRGVVLGGGSERVGDGGVGGV